MIKKSPYVTCQEDEDHDWEQLGQYDFEGDKVYFTQYCNRCGIKGYEVFAYSGVIDNEGKEIATSSF